MSVTPFPNAFGSQADEAWAAGHTGSRNVYVGITDTGVQITHPDLDANIWTNPFDPVNGVDDDGNGYVDDVHGWDFEHGTTRCSTARATITGRTSPARSARRAATASAWPA